MPLYNPSASTDATITFTDITTNNSSTTKHGFLKKLDNSATNFMNGQGNWAAPGVSAAGVQAGTSFPGSPATNDVYFRTDRGLVYFYDGAQWLTWDLYHLTIPNVVGSDALAATNGAAYRTTVWNAVYDVYLVDFLSMTFVSTTNDGTNKWTVTLSKESKAAAYAQTTITSFSTGTTPDTASQFIVHTVSINALLGTTSGTLTVGVTKVSAPGNITSAHAVTCRLLG